MTAANLCHEIPWNELKYVYVIGEKKDGKIMIGATAMDAKTAAFFRMISEDALTDLAHMFGLTPSPELTPPPPPTEDQ
jgi:hypothetical protein